MMNPSDVPIIGETIISIPPQARLNARDAVGDSLAQLKQLGLKHGRVITNTPSHTTDLHLLLMLDALVEAGCRIISITEHPMGNPNSREINLQVNVVFRTPDFGAHS